MMAKIDLYHKVLSHSLVESWPQRGSKDSKTRRKAPPFEAFDAVVWVTLYDFFIGFLASLGAGALVTRLRRKKKKKPSLSSDEIAEELESLIEELEEFRYHVMVDDKLEADLGRAVATTLTNYGWDLDNSDNVAREAVKCLLRQLIASKAIRGT